MQPFLVSNPQQENTLIVIEGPTAVGKTALAIRIAKMFHTEIISCDSRQFYQELNIGVARPSKEELSQAPHHFVAHRTVQKPYNAWEFEHEAIETIERLHSSHNVVVAVGGSGLYLEALCRGIVLLPDPTPELREEITQRIQKEGIEWIQKEVQRLDPEYYSEMDTQNPARLQRALEVCLTAQMPYSTLRRQQTPKRPFRILEVALTCPKEELRQRINLRVDLMMQEGLLNEVRDCLPFRNLNTLNTVGYKEFFPILEQGGNNPKLLQEATVQVKNHTWQYAKKQLTWLKRSSLVNWIERKDSEEFLQRLEREIRG